MASLLKLKNMRYKKVSYASFANGINVDYDENLTPVKYSKLTYNFNYKNGALIKGLGIDANLVFHHNTKYPEYTKTLVIADDMNVQSAGLYRYVEETYGMDLSRLVFYCSDGTLKYNYVHADETTIREINDVNFTSPPLMFNYQLNGQCCLIATTPKDGMWVISSSGNYKVENTPKITSLCLHYERLFVTVENDKSAVWFSDDLDPTNWTVDNSQAGFIKMYDDRGDVIKVVSFNDYVYIFREYGITRLTAYAKQEEFDLTNLFVSSGRIYKNSITICGDRIMFLASDGLYVFNGSSTSKVELNIDNLFSTRPNLNCVSAFHDGYYYLACNLDFNDKHNKIVGSEEDMPYENNALIQINISTGELSIARGVNIVSLNPVCTRSFNCMLASVKTTKDTYRLGVVNNCGKIFETPTLKYWKSPYSDFGLPNASKLIKELYFNCDGEVTVYINIDGKTYAYNTFDSVGDLRKLKVNLRGFKIAIDFESNSEDVVISNPQAIIGY